MNLSLVGLASAFLLLAGMPITPAGAHASPPDPDAERAIPGTFLQLSDRYGDWDEARWSMLFADFERLGVKQLVIQWTVHDSLAAYRSAHFTSTGDAPLEHLLRLADAAQMEVWVGLAHDSRWWRWIDRQRDEKALEVSLRRLEQDHLAVVRELAPRMSRHPSFRGWYLPEEIDDRSWLAAGRRALLRAHLERVGAAVRTLTPEASLAVSGFSNGFADPATLAALWHELVASTPVDRVLFQDGIGVHKLDLDELPMVLGAVAGGVAAGDGVLQVVVELFEQIAGAPMDDGPFAARPADARRVERQMALARTHSTGGVIVFALPEYWTSSGGPEAAHAMARWLAGER